MTSFTQDFDSRFNLRYYEIHMWRGSGRIMIINADFYPIPMVTELTVNVGTGQIDNATFIVAYILAEASDPKADLLEHTVDGHIVKIDLTGFSRTDIK